MDGKTGFKGSDNWEGVAGTTVALVTDRGHVVGALDVSPVPGVGYVISLVEGLFSFFLTKFFIFNPLTASSTYVFSSLIKVFPRCSPSNLSSNPTIYPLDDII
jgi:hypothetical protein